MGNFLDRIREWLYPDLFGGRSSQWSGVRKENIKSYCEFCERKPLLGLNLHHILPFHLYPEAELDPTNFITVCRHCHLYFAHLGSFKSFNKDIKKEAEEWQTKRKHRP